MRPLLQLPAVLGHEECAPLTSKPLSPFELLFKLYSGLGYLRDV
jgi:hypothetical protein